MPVLRYALLLLLGSTCGFAQTCVCKLSGTVIDAVSKSPVEGASILMSFGSNEDVRQLGVSDRAGRFSIPSLRAGSYRVMAAARGYAPQFYGAAGPQQQRVEVHVGGANESDVVIELYPAGDVKGQLIDDGSIGVPGATVELLARKPFRGGVHLMTLGSRVSDSKGNYGFQSVAPGKYYLRVRRYPRLTPAAAVQDPSNCLPNVLYYPGAAVAEGAAEFTVFSRQVTSIGQLKFVGGACRSVRVKLEHAPSLVRVALIPGETFGIEEPPTEPVIIREEEKVLEFAAISSGDYTLLVEETTHSQSPPQVRQIQASGGDVNVSVRMEPGSITGKLQGVETKLPTELMLEPVAVANGSVRAKVGADGTFTFPAIREGDYFLPPRVLPKGVFIASMSVNGSPMEGHVLHHTGTGAVNLLIQLRCCGAGVAGIVEAADGRLDRPAAVLLLPESLARRTPENMMVTMTGVNGAFSFAGVPPGRYKVIAIENLRFGQGVDPEFAALYQESGTEVEVGEAGAVNVKVRARSE
jgi:hypothetical protein